LGVEALGWVVGRGGTLTGALGFVEGWTTVVVVGDGSGTGSVVGKT